jgi:hypothetical protein
MGDTWVAAALPLPRVVELRLDTRTTTRAGALDRESFPGDRAAALTGSTRLCANHFACPAWPTSWCRARRCRPLFHNHAAVKLVTLPFNFI